MIPTYHSKSAKNGRDGRILHYSKAAAKLNNVLCSKTQWQD